MTGATAPVGILLAAGRGSRFDPTGQRNKLLQVLPDGRPVALASAQALLAVLPRVLAVVPDASPELAFTLQSAGCEVLACPDARLGMGHTLAAGVAATADAGGWIVALADMPFVQPSTIQRLVQALEQGERIVAPAWQGQRGHPVGFSAHYCGALLALRGDEGARALLRSDPPLLLEVGDPGVVRDIDTPIDLPE